MTKAIYIGLLTIAFFAGSATTGMVAYAAPNGDPFQELQSQINIIVQEITPITQVFEETNADSFFDVFVTHEEHDSETTNLQDQIDNIQANQGVLGSYVRENTKLIDVFDSITVECDTGDINTGGFLKGTPGDLRLLFAEYEGTESFVAYIKNTNTNGVFGTIQVKCLDVTS